MAGAMVAMLGAPALAGGLDVDPFQPYYAPDTAILNVATTTVLDADRPALGVFYHLASGLFRQPEVGAQGQSTFRDVVETSHRLELSAAIGLGDIADLGLTIPVVLGQSLAPGGLGGNTPSSASGVGDVRLDARLRLTSRVRPSGFGAGVVIGVMLPTGDSETLMGAAVARLHPRLVVDWQLPGGGFGVATNLGVMVAPEVAIGSHTNGSAFRWSVGVDAGLGLKGLHLLASVHGSVALNEAPSQDADGAPVAGASPVEVDAALQYRLSSHHLVFTAGAGAGLNTDVGAPTYRVLASVAWVYGSTGNQDHAHRNVPDDRCPRADPEDMYADNGCPQADTDGDGIVDVDDKCPNVPEDRDGFADDDGCPDDDNDADGILDVDDKCPNDPEDLDRFEDGDGCPDPDNDGDRIPDVDDKCPNEPETYNGRDDADGCPDRGLVHPVGIRIEILEKVFFASRSAKIPAAAKPMLEEVAKVLVANSKVTKVRVEGHTDGRGRATANLRLSLKRAETVRDYLIARGVPPARLEVGSYGPDKPLYPHRTKKGRAFNNRVEFRVLEVRGKKQRP